MTHKVLVAFDGSDNAMRAIEYIADYFIKESRITLFSVIQGTAASSARDEAGPVPFFASEQNPFRILELEKKKALNEALEEARERLIRAGFKEDHVSIQTKADQKGITREIAEEAQSGDYNIIVLGRRGLSEFQEHLLGSVSQKIIHMAKNIGILLVG